MYIAISVIYIIGILGRVIDLFYCSEACTTRSFPVVVSQAILWPLYALKAFLNSVLKD